MYRTAFILIFIVFSTSLYSQKTKAEKDKGTTPFILGLVDEIRSEELGEKRILNIYLPEGYNEKDTIKYPVIYLLDGSADEDFIHIAGLVQFNSFEWVNRVPKSIIVGIATVDRRRDFTFTTTIEEDKKRFPSSGHSGKFISFIEKELQPFINGKYKTNTSKTIIGQSLGGLLATEILFTKPDIFNTYIIVSPSLWWNNGTLLNTPAKTASSRTTVYIGVGKEGLTPTAIPRVMEVDANLLAEKLKKENKNTEVIFDYLPDENHATILHQAVLNAFKLIYNNKHN
jgi:hypothetical protein